MLPTPSLSRPLAAHGRMRLPSALLLAVGRDLRAPSWQRTCVQPTTRPTASPSTTQAPSLTTPTWSPSAKGVEVPIAQTAWARTLGPAGPSYLASSPPLPAPWAWLPQDEPPLTLPLTPALALILAAEPHPQDQPPLTLPLTLALALILAAEPHHTPRPRGRRLPDGAVPGTGGGLGGAEVPPALGTASTSAAPSRHPRRGWVLDAHGPGSTCPSSTLCSAGSGPSVGQGGGGSFHHSGPHGSPHIVLRGLWRCGTTWCLQTRTRGLQPGSPTWTSPTTSLAETRTA